MKRNNSVSNLKDFRKKERQQLGVGVSMVSLDTYVAWNIVIPSVLSALLWLVLLILVVVVITCFKKLPHILFEMIQLSLPVIEEHEDYSCVTVGGHKIKKWALKILSLVIPLTIVTIFFSFWNVWLVEEEARGVCLSHFDCFPVFNGSVLQKTPVESCFMELFNISVGDLDSTLSGLPNVTEQPAVAETVAVVRGEEVDYKCYRFVFRYAEGIGAAGGILFFTAVVSKLYFCLLVSIITTDGYDKCRFVLLCFFWGFAGLLCLLFVVVNIATPMVRDAVFETHTDIVQFCLYAANLIAVVCGGYVISAGVICAEL